MRVAIAGAHGKVGMRLVTQLVSRGDAVTGLIRNPDHAAELREAGAQAAVCDLEHASVQDVAAAVEGADAVVFAAGAGPGSGAARKVTMDRDGAIKLIEATATAAPRYVMLSAVGAENPPDDDDVFSVYLRAKAEADAALEASDREWAIVRPGRLTDDSGTGHLRVETDPFRGEVPREDLAAMIAALLHDPRATHVTLYVNSGSQAIDAALDAVLGQQA